MTFAMRYIIILSSFVLCAAHLHVTERFRTHISGVSNVSENAGSVERQQPFKPSKRHKRSVWSMIIDHLAAVAETFQMKPALVGGINGIEDFNGQLKKKLPELSKSDNAIPSEGVDDFNIPFGTKFRGKINPRNFSGDGFLLIESAEFHRNEKEMKRYLDEFYSKYIPIKKKVCKRGPGKNLYFGLEVVKPTAEKSAKYALLDAINYVFTLNKRAKRKERKITTWLANSDLRVISTNDRFNIYTQQLNDKKTEQILKDVILKLFPKKKEKLMRALRDIEDFRNFIKIISKKLLNKLKNVYVGIRYRAMHLKLMRVKKDNDQWLSYKRDPEFVAPERQPYKWVEKPLSDETQS